jgi:outer membrane lipoprotein carrier protein
MTLLITFSLASTAYCITAQEIVENIQKIYDDADDYTAEFYQESEMSSIKRVQKAEGVVYFKKKGKMYWEYKKPTRQKVISNGKKMWLYQPDINQVQEFNYNDLEAGKAQSSFLNGIGKLSEEFDIEFKGDKVEGNLVLDLKSKEESSFKNMKMYIDSENYNIVKTFTTDAYGNTNSITFKNIRFNTGVADDFFVFKAPKGVNIVTQPTDQ